MQDDKKSRRPGRLILAAVSGMLLLGAVRYAGSSISISSNVNGRELPVRSVQTDEPEVILTFDVAWKSDDLDELLTILEEEGVRSTFFLTGEWVDQNPEQVKRISDGGHDLGSHSQNHENMTLLGEEERKKELEQVQTKVRQLTGTQMEFFRPPYGNYDDDLIRQAKELGYYTVTWDVDSQDWKDYGKEAILREVLENKDLQKGSIILFHTGTRYLADVLRELICGLREAGYEPVPLSELIIRDDYRLDVTGRQQKKES